MKVEVQDAPGDESTCDGRASTVSPFVKRPGRLPLRAWVFSVVVTVCVVMASFELIRAVSDHFFVRELAERVVKESGARA